MPSALPDLVTAFPQCVRVVQKDTIDTKGSGVLIDDTHVLTAAHLKTEIPASQLAVIVQAGLESRMIRGTWKSFGQDAIVDVAQIELDESSGGTPATFAAPADVTLASAACMVGFSQPIPSLCVRKLSFVAMECNRDEQRLFGCLSGQAVAKVEDDGEKLTSEDSGGPLFVGPADALKLAGIHTHGVSESSLVRVDLRTKFERFARTNAFARWLARLLRYRMPGTMKGRFSRVDRP